MRGQRLYPLLALALMLAVAALAVVVFCLYDPMPPTRGGGGAVTVLTWRRSLKAGDEVSRDAVLAVKVPRSSVRVPAEVMTPEDAGALAGAWLVRDVRKDDFVRHRDIQPFARAPRKPGTGGEAVVEVNEDELEPIGKGRYLGPTRTAMGGRFRDGPRTRPAGSSAPPDLAGESFAAAGLRRITGAVPGAVVPGKSTRLYAFRRKVPGGSADTLAYLIGMDLASAEKFYRTRMPQAGYNLIVGRDSAAGGRRGRILAFAKGREHYCYVNLYRTDKDSEVKAVLVIARPGS